VTGTLDSYTTKTATSNTVTVVISDPCFSTVIDTKAVLDMAASVLGTSDTKSFTAFTDSVATASSAFGADNCGVATYRITMSDGTSGVPAYLTLSGKTLTLTPTLTSQIGTHNIKLHVDLTPFSVTHTEDFQVVISECVPTITAPTAPTAIVQEVGLPAVTSTAFADYTYLPSAATCGFAFTYTAVQSDNSVLPAAITFDPSSKVFTVVTTDSAQAGIYTVKIKATLDNVAVTIDESVTFTVTINDNCKNDEVTLTAGTEIADSTFYIETPALTTTYSATFTHTFAQCPIAYSLKENTAAYSSAFITNFDTTTGVITISTDSLTFDKVTKTLEVTCTSTLSTHSNAAVSDSFDLTLKDECWDSVLTAPVLTANYPWDLYA